MDPARKRPIADCSVELNPFLKKVIGRPARLGRPVWRILAGFDFSSE